MESRPQSTHMIRDNPTLPTSCITPFGEIKIPIHKSAETFRNILRCNMYKDIQIFKILQILVYKKYNLYYEYT